MTVQKVRVYPVALGSNINYSGYYTHGVLLSYAKVYKDGLLCNTFDFEKIQPIMEEDIAGTLDRLKSFDQPIVFLLSSYVWNHEVNLVFAREAKKNIPNSLCVFGGPHIPRAEKPLRKLMDAHPCIDVAVRGEGEQTLAELLECVALSGERNKISDIDFSSVASIAFRRVDLQIIYTGIRERIKDINVIPSPYLTGELDHLPVMPDILILETNRGCPFGCTFCDWGGATLSKIYQFDKDRILAEIDYLSSRGTQHLLVADANFGVFERDIEFAEKAVELNRACGSPATMGVFLAKNSPERVGRVVRILHSRKMLVDAVASLQSTDKVVLENIKRSNIKESAYENLISVYHDIGLLPSTDILVGMPGQNVQSLKNDLQFAFDRHVVVRTFLVQILPNSPMADEAYMEKYNIVMDEEGYVESADGFDKEGRDQMVKFRVATVLHADEKFSFYFLLYLQVEHGVKAMDMVAAMMDVPLRFPEKYPLLAWSSENMLNFYRFFGSLSIRWKKNASRIFADLDAVWREILQLASEEFGVTPDSLEVENLVRLQKLIMPTPGQKHAGEVTQFDFDFMDYFAQFSPKLIPVISNMPESFRPLSTYRCSTQIMLPEQPGLHRAGYAFTRDMFQGSQWALDIGLPV
jgi:radical SAM superfamily enzyme YgiQ (UPF0313 family)